MRTALVVIHVLAAAVWVGGVVALTFAAVPVLRRLPPAERAASLRSLGRRWRPLGWSALAVAVASGLVLAQDWNAYDPDVLLDTRFGRILTAKSALVAAVVVLSGLHHALGPRLARQIREQRPQTARRPLVLVGRASLAATLAIPVLAVLMTRT